MTRRGFSLSNGDGRMPLPFLNDAGISFSPPVYSGIVPSLLAAFSAPTAVSVVPSCFASSAETAASAGAASDATRERDESLVEHDVVLLRTWS